MKNLPIGVQDLTSFPDRDFVYVDKTELVYHLITRGKYYFLSRPRRFGKSLLISTFKHLFLGNKALFESLKFGEQDLWIMDKWDWTKKYPVIHFSFDALSYQDIGLANAIQADLLDKAEAFGIELTKSDFKSQFKELLKKVVEKHGKIVLLIDEYDKPIIDFLEKDDLPQAKANRLVLKSFYSTLKSADDLLHFFFVTGISKFTQVSIFSDLNNLKDITLHEDYAALTGYTQAEIEFYFSDYLELATKKLRLTHAELAGYMRIWYDGYSWDGITMLYNPFGTLNFLDQRRFRNFWFATGTPTFLVNQIKKQVHFDFEKTLTNDGLLNKYDIEDLQLVPLLFQAGYLTVKHINLMTGAMVMDYPNQEVRESMYQFLIDDLARDVHRADTGLTIKDLNTAFLSNDLQKAKKIINSLVSTLPYEAYKNQSEGFYQGLLHLIFSYLGMFVDSEVHMAGGRADTVVQTLTHIFIFEFKFNKTPEAALEQIEKNGYANKYQSSDKHIIGIGVNFNEDKRLIDGWLEKNLAQ